MSMMTKNQQIVPYKSSFYCANCGGYGHLHRQCNHPITSYGIICFRLVNNQIQYVLVQRKDSLSYIEFLRGKYALNQKQYIMKLVSNMTEMERHKLMHGDFADLWRTLWQVEKSRSFQKEFLEAKIKYDILKSGYILRSGNASTWFNLKSAINNTKNLITEPEWGFPKGRRNINEDDYACATREFKEETNIPMKHVSMLNIQPFEEIFSGTNHVRYRHVYYLAIYNPSCTSVQDVIVNPHNRSQCREIQAVKWMPYEDAQSKIREINVERKELFKRVHANIQKLMSSLTL